MPQHTHSNLYYVRSILRQTWNHPSNEHHRWTAVARALAWQVTKRLRPTPRDIDYFGWKLRCHPDSNSASNVVYFTEMYDIDEMDFMVAYLRPGDGFVDAGANIGTYSLLARSLVGQSGRVEAFEPHPVAAARCRENVALNGITNITVHEMAVADEVGSAEFLDGYDVSNRIRSESDGDTLTRSVVTGTLDDSLGTATFALGKLDVEGHEVAALRGGVGRLAAADPPVWQLEIFDHQLARAGTDRAELMQLLEEHEFDLASYTRAEGIRRLGADARPVSNVWAVHRAAWPEVERRLAGRQAAR